MNLDQINALELSEASEISCIEKQWWSIPVPL